MSEQTQDLVQLIRQRLQAAIRRITLADFLYGLVLTVGVVALVWLVAAGIEAGFWLGAGARTAVFWGFVVVAAGLAAYFLGLPLLRLAGVLRGPSEEGVARQIGTRYPEVSDRLVNMLHLVEGRSSEAPSPLLDGAVRMLGEQVRPVPFEQVEDFRRARQAGRLATVPVVGLLVFLLAAPGTFLGASARLISPGEVFQRPAPFSLLVEPGTVDLVKGSSFDVTVRAEGSELPAIVEFAYQQEGEDRIETIRLAPEEDGTFRHTFVNVRQTFRYRASAAPVETAWYTATVTARPLVRSLQVALSFPRYTGIPPQQLVPNVGDVTALPGTRVGVEVGVGGDDVQEAFVRFDDGSLDTLALNGERAAGSFTLRREGSYQVVLRNGSGIENNEPITYALTLLADAFPAIAIIEPEPLAELDESLQVGLRMRINDDFGFARLRLFYRLAESRFGTPFETFETVDLPLESPRLLDQDIAYTWLLKDSGLDPVPGDVIEYYVQVWDNDAVAGYKPARSATHRLRLPSLAEQYDELDEAQDEATSEMEDLMRQTEQVRDQFEELRDELRRKQEGDWEDKRQLEQIQERQQNLEERVEELTQQLDSMTDQMQENNLVDDETLEMYQELQRVSEEINSPELMEALKQLQEAMQQLDLQQMQESIENFEFNSEQYRQRLERTLDLFKRLQIQQQLDEAARRAEELAKQQERLQEETEKLSEERDGEPEKRRDGEEDREGERESGREGGNEEGEQQEGENQEGEQGENQEGENQEGENQQGENQQGENQRDAQQGDQQRAEELAQQQEQNSEEMKALEEKMREVLEKMQEMKNTPQSKMEQLQQQTEQQQLPQQMQQNAEQLRQQQTDQAQQQQQQMQQQLQKLQEQLQSMQQGMQGQQQQINMAGLARALNDVLTLSQQQEDLRGQVGNAAGDSPRLRDFAQRQIELAEGLRVVSDTLQSLSKDIPMMTRAVQKEAGEAQRAMAEATDALADRASRQAGTQQKASMMHLNELALLLSDLMDQMMNSSASGQGQGQSMQQMLQQLQNMAGQQQQLNQQIQQMINDMQGNRLSQDAQQRLRQMAAQQEALRRQLKDLARNREFNNKALGDLDKIAEQMQETIQDLQRQRVGRRTVQRQQQILTRLLDAQRSLQERGKEKRREGRTGEDELRESPGTLTPSEQAEQLRRALLRALESGYAPDYEELIKRYFELLQQER